MWTPRNIAIQIACLLVVIYLLRALFRAARIRRFHSVHKGVLCRGGQPSKLALWLLCRVFGIKTIVNLREDFVANETTFGMAETIIPIPPRTNIPTTEQVEQFLDIYDDTAKHPILVHCKVGANRTGIMVACVRILRDGWTYDDALAEMKKISGKTVPDHAQEALRDVTETLKNKSNSDGGEGSPADKS